MVEHSSNIVALCFDWNTSQQKNILKTCCKMQNICRSGPGGQRRWLGGEWTRIFQPFVPPPCHRALPSATRGLQRATRGLGLGQNLGAIHLLPNLNQRLRGNWGNIGSETLLPWKCKETFSSFLIHLKLGSSAKKSNIKRNVGAKSGEIDHKSKISSGDPKLLLLKMHTSNCDGEF